MNDLLAHLLWPTSCAVCGFLGEDLCDPCFSRLERNLRLDHSTLPNGVPAMAGAPHEGISKDLILLVKYGGRAALGFRLGQILAARIPSFSDACVIPAPLHKGSRRYYNQATWIAAGLARKWSAPVIDGLCWTTRHPRQTSVSLWERRNLPRGACSWVGPDLGGRTCVVVDDVRTTGTTLLRVSEAIQEAGGNVVLAVTWTASRLMFEKEN
ncbi:MAG: phosphoribosyltransferase [Dethiosulfovibrio peptidovorans]|nr:MAG: phosphoribosyltransferase [Dethiosulfovibrio peptidovorans]